MKVIALILILVCVAELNCLPAGAGEAAAAATAGAGCEVTLEQIKDFVKKNKLDEKLKEKLEKFFECVKPEEVECALCELMKAAPQGLCELVGKALEAMGVDKCKLQQVITYVYENWESIDLCELAPFFKDVFCIVTRDIVCKKIKEKVMSKDNWETELCTALQSMDCCQMWECFKQHLKELCDAECLCLLKKVICCLVKHFVEGGNCCDELGEYKITAECVICCLKKLQLFDCIKEELCKALKEKGPEAIKQFFSDPKSVECIKKYLCDIGCNKDPKECLEMVCNYIQSNGDKVACGLMHCLAEKVAECANCHLKKYLEDAEAHVFEKVQEDIKATVGDEKCICKILKKIFCPEEVGQMAIHLICECMAANGAGAGAGASASTGAGAGGAGAGATNP